MINKFIHQLQEILASAPQDNLSNELSYIFQESQKTLPFEIISLSIIDNNLPAPSAVDFYRVLNKNCDHKLEKQFKDKNIVIEYKFLGNKEDATLLVEILALYLNQKLESFLEKQKLEDLLKNQNEENSALVKMFCHDLVNPLSILNMSLEFLEDSEVNIQYANILSRMKKSSESLQYTIQSFRELNALQNKNKNLFLEKLSLVAIFNECKKNFQPTLDAKNITLKLKLPNQNDVEFFADRQTFLNYIFNNLISNAIKFSKENSTVEIVAEKESNQIYLSIVDHGLGMNNQQINNIFKFDKSVQRLGTHGEAGSGFGLQFCRYALNLHGFKLQISSKEKDSTQSESGTTFKLTIPISA